MSATTQRQAGASEIRAELIRTNCYTRFPCHACGGKTEKVGVLCEVPESHSTAAGFRVCERCLEAGDLVERMRGHAEVLEQRAIEVRDIASRLRVPSYHDWLHAERLFNALYDEDTPFEEAMAWPVQKQLQFIAAKSLRKSAESEEAP